MINLVNNIWNIDTALTKDTIPKMFPKYKNDLKSIKTNLLKIDFKNCPKIDSAGLALIIEYVKYCKHNSITIELYNLCPMAIDLAITHGAKNILCSYIKKEEI